MADVATSVALVIQGQDKTAAAFRSVGKSADGLAAKLSKAIKFAAAGASVAGLGIKAKQALDDMTRLHDLAQQSGVSSSWLTQFTGALGQAGINLQITDIVNSIQKLNAGLVNTEKIAALDKLGIDIRDLQGLAPEKAFVGFLQKVAAVNDEQTRSLALMRGMEEMGLKMAPLLRQGPDAFSESLGKVMRMIPSVSDKTVDLATGTSNALSILSQDMQKTFWAGLGSLLGYTDSATGGIEASIQKSYFTAKAFAENFAVIVGSVVSNAVSLIKVATTDIDTALGIWVNKVSEVREALFGYAAYTVARLQGRSQQQLDIIAEKTAKTVGRYAAQVDRLVERSGVAFTDVGETLAANEAELRRKLREIDEGVEAKASLSVIAPPESALAGLSASVKSAVRSGAKDGLMEGIEATSYDALKTAIAGASSRKWADVSAVVRSVAPVAPRVASAAGSAVVSGGSGSGKIEDLLTRILSVIDGGAKTLRKLEAF